MTILQILSIHHSWQTRFCIQSSGHNHASKDERYFISPVHSLAYIKWH